MPSFSVTVQHLFLLPPRETPSAAWEDSGCPPFILTETSIVKNLRVSWGRKKLCCSADQQTGLQSGRGASGLDQYSKGLSLFFYETDRYVNTWRQGVKPTILSFHAHAISNMVRSDITEYWRQEIRKKLSSCTRTQQELQICHKLYLY